ncbi:rab effector Noc2 [Trichonephila inaurata madagascariensis]|uniref:Rab effector Noc2 n=1 Tax=Trichonephila inaurata madagascariensis TaxID=2747483 RepID=A0A8X6Y8F2_9ARAC|nr:rab effector Noc2 [Trichonephila inaurata madagascariensis]
MSAAEGKKRWNCPSDRELVLRAKLNSGWSIHSQDYFQKPEPILDPELRSIENVMERAKQIDIAEKDRIERMVWRLENMKRNTVGDGKKNCSMCGISFGFFRTSSINCCDCLMAVCEKCRIDIQNVSQEICVLCKICAENREVWKKSGGWFYGKVPSNQTTDQNDKCSQKSESPNCGRAFNTWEHRKQDIVRLESFEPPEENHNENTLYKNWAVNSSPDISSLDESISISEETTKRVRKSSDDSERLEMYHLSAPEDSKLSVSCPSLEMPEEIPVYKQAEIHRKRHRFSRKKIFTPAHKMMEKLTRYRKTSAK